METVKHDLIITVGDKRTHVVHEMAAQIRRHVLDITDRPAAGTLYGDATYEGEDEHSAAILVLGITTTQAHDLERKALDVALSHDQYAIGYWLVPEGGALSFTGKQ